VVRHGVLVDGCNRHASAGVQLSRVGRRESGGHDEADVTLLDVTLLNDDTLTRSLTDDPEAGFEAVVRAYQHRLYAFALRFSGSPRDAEEIAQDAFVRAYRALATYDAERIATLRLRAWLFQITVNVARNRARGRRLDEVSLPTSGGTDESTMDIRDEMAETPERVAERKDEEEHLAAIVASLPERYRASVVLRHIQGLSYQEIAAVLGQPAGTVKSNVHRGVALLRQALDRPDTGSVDRGPGTPELALGGAS